MYQKYWGLKVKPFENSPDPKFLYHSKEHDDAILRILYAIQSLKGAMLLSGEYGCGKTLILHTIINNLNTSKYNIAFITNPNREPKELIKEILYQLGIEWDSDSHTDMLHTLNDFLYSTIEEGGHTLIIIDEAQAIETKETLEELRMLLNFQMNDRFMLTLFLVGQPEIREKLKSIPQFNQRISIRHHLKRFDKKETQKYINYRLRAAGRYEPIFTEKAYQNIYDYSDGIPRKINNICDLSLVTGATQQVDKIGTEIINNIVQSEE